MSTPGNAPIPARPTIPAVLNGARHSGASATGSRASWPRTDRPLTIAILGWARVSSQGREGSGYNLSKSELARGLVLSGHKVYSLSSGMIYRLGGLRAGGPHIAKRESWGGVECYELRNSPNVSPAAFNFRNTTTELTDPRTTRMVVEWIRAVGAHVVHVHSQEGLALDVIPAIEAAGVPVVATLHNYWFVCPQVDLLRQERSVCLDYEGGRACESCMPGKDVAKLRSQRAWGQSLEYALGLYPADVIRKAAYGVKPLLRALGRGRFIRRYEPKALNPDMLNDPELAAGFGVSGSVCGAAPDTLIHHDPPIDKGEEPVDYERAKSDANERVLAGTNHRVSLNIYGARRDAGVAALAAASLVTPPSDYLRRVHVAMGVPEQKTRWVRLGQPHFDQINRRARRSPYYDLRPWSPAAATRPLRFAFFGTTRPNKGLEVLVRAIPLIEPALRRRIHIAIHAQGWDLGFRKRLSTYPEVSVWGGYDLYQLISAAGEYDVGILSHIWLENSPLVLLENFHAGKMVICSRLGGPVDWVKDPASHPGEYNGLFFPGGDEHALAACIERLIRGDVVIPSPREIHQRTTLQSYPAHVQEVETIYRQVIDGAARKRPAAASAREATGL